MAISQRNHTQQFPHLKRDRMVIRSQIIEFFDDVILKRFASGEVDRYCFDVYVDTKDRIWVLDFNVWGVQTDSLLFEWDELMKLTPEKEEVWTIDNANPEFRIVANELEIRQDPLASYRAPIDTVNLASMTDGAVGNFEDFMALCERPSNIDD